ncbi:bifunctional DNA primase/polymerase [Streptomyces lunaelactis]|uniref:bifunctional DNA primase/polymerase n=1 Tax=Streptomyces lunaelactis TaxID=1535768 RepID=UPI0015855317|nr:bifunctional DNA primase/polymerase [Streptomyces lunaelactis]NUL05344.1 bifunctional DNA primase/polymerase [Streptomyces lunaelactis]
MPQPERFALPQAAQAAAARGWHVFPLIPGDKRPAIRNWEARATTDPARIARCWGHAPYNIGIATGPSRLVVVDLDTTKDPDDVPPAEWAQHGVRDGADVFRVLREQHDAHLFPPAFGVATVNGGAHLYFAAPAGPELRNSAGKLGWKVDTRAGGGYVVAVGSIVNGRTYEVTSDAVIPELPEWLVELLRPAPLPPQKPIMVLLASDRRGSYLRVAITGELERVTRAQQGERNKALYLASIALGQLVAGGELGEAEVTEWLTAAALQAGQSEREARRTVASGLRAGANRPRTVAA